MVRMCEAVVHGIVNRLSILGNDLINGESSMNEMEMKKASFCEQDSDDRVRCKLCPHRCLIRPGRRGICGVRENRDGVLYSLVYGKPAAEGIDPIEKKPLYHFLPGSISLSIGTRGCNLKCLHCQNWQSSQVTANEDFDDQRFIEPGKIVQSALTHGCGSISYTYTEPTIFLEYALDTARVAVSEGLKNVFVTNGFITPEALDVAAPLIDGTNIDLKFFNDEIYRKICGARLQPVLDAISLYHKHNVWIEITTLVIPTLNDGEDQLRGIAGFIASVDKNIPWHVTAFYPTYRLTGIPAATLSVLQRARQIGYEEGLRFVYTGNLPDDEGNTTRCPDCGETVINRCGRRASLAESFTGSCIACGHAIAGVWR